MSSGAFSTVVDSRRELPAPMASDCVNQTLAVGAVAVQSAQFNLRTSLVRVFSTVDCFLEFGPSPTATTSSIFCAGGIYQYFGVKQDQRLSVIAASVSGTIYVMEVGE